MASLLTAGFPQLPVRHTYIATTRYSKEVRASLELGDTVYLHDSSVEVFIPDIGGVLVLETSLPSDSLAKLLSEYSLSAVEYVTYVVSCISCYSVELSEVVSYIIDLACRDRCFNKIRTPRTGSLGREFISGVRAGLSGCVSRECSGTLSLEVFGSTLCFGPVVYPGEAATRVSM
ncbi:MAG: hypothetical protein RMI56_00860 [Sulfolobales archaeon]|nr:hypothetical protein [Sulfolobales archaeon]MDW8082329.1 hypothetical protein [Sulfolobales archaeon]